MGLTQIEPSAQSVHLNDPSARYQVLYVSTEVLYVPRPEVSTEDCAAGYLGQ